MQYVESLLLYLLTCNILLSSTLFQAAKDNSKCVNVVTKNEVKTMKNKLKHGGHKKDV